jgi:hypothetical protein
MPAERPQPPPLPRDPATGRILSPFRLSVRLREFEQGPDAREKLLAWMDHCYWCWCGFYHLWPGESLRRHLVDAFAPADWLGSDGKEHQEVKERTCQCGFTAESARWELEAHILYFFVPDNSNGTDGEIHHPMDGEYYPPDENRRPLPRWRHL